MLKEITDRRSIRRYSGREISDQYLNDLVGGEENRMEYLPYNKLDDIHHVHM